MTEDIAAPDAPRDRSLVPLAIVFCVVSLGILAVAQRGQLAIEMPHDGAHYLALARSLLRGEGFANTTHWALSLPKDSLPYPDTYRAPLYPTLIAGAAWISGAARDAHLFGAAKLVSVLFGACIAPVTFVFARRRLGAGTGTAIVAGAITLVHHHLVIAGTKPLTEAVYTPLALGGLFLITGPRPRPFLAGLAAGLAILTRYQGLVLLPAFAVAYLFQSRSEAVETAARRFGRWARGAALIAVAAVAVLAPWLWRNAQVTGSPFYTDLTYHLVSTADPRVSFYEYFHRPTPSPIPIDYGLANLESAAVLFAYRLSQIARNIAIDNAGNPVLLLLAMIGLVTVVRGARTDRQRHHDVLGVIVFVLLNVALAGVSFAKSRLMMVVDPLAAILAASAVSALWSGIPSRSHLRWGARIAGLALLIGGVGWEVDRSIRKLARVEPSEYAWADAVAGVIGGDVDPGETVMAASPYHFAERLDCFAVSLPYGPDSTIRQIARQFHTRYVVVGASPSKRLYPGSFLERGPAPPWIRRVRELTAPDVVLYEVDLAALGPAAPSPDDRAVRPERD